jgi:hypothetical protein
MLEWLLTILGLTTGTVRPIFCAFFIFFCKAMVNTENYVSTISTVALLLLLYFYLKSCGQKFVFRTVNISIPVVFFASGSNVCIENCLNRS